mgnify:CR=1 FL=1
MEKRDYSKYYRFTNDEKKSFRRNYLRSFLILGIMFLMTMIIAHGFNYSLWPVKFLFYLILFPLLLAFFKKIEKTKV